MSFSLRCAPGADYSDSIPFELYVGDNNEFAVDRLANRYETLLPD